MRRIFRPAALLVALMIAFPMAVSAAERQVTIEVKDAASQPVAGATVWISADEMDAVGTTDAQGRVTVRTTSPSVRVTAAKDGRDASTVSEAARITLVLTGGAR